MKTPSKNALKKLWQHGVVTNETTLFLHVKNENHTYKYVSLCYIMFSFQPIFKKFN